MTSTATDRHGREIAQGHEVDVVYGGAYHRMTVRKVHAKEHGQGPAEIEGDITIRAVAATAAKVTAAEDHQNTTGMPTGLPDTAKDHRPDRPRTRKGPPREADEPANEEPAFSHSTHRKHDGTHAGEVTASSRPHKSPMPRPGTTPREDKPNQTDTNHHTPKTHTKEI
ncbi:MAG: hypothetical protein ACR2JC_20850 [Chloroflexota bacterium]